MGKSTISDEAKTIVLVGRTGNGKSATGNSIIGADVFDSMPSSAGVTATCQLHKTVLHNDQILNVIDTPGLFDTRVEPEIIRNEIGKCIKMAKNGIHAVVFVLSVKNRFSEEEASAIEMLKQFFGGKIGDYMIVVFTHGDALRKMTLADYMGHNCPEPLRRILEMCGNRYILFDNMTEDELKKSQQQKELLCLVDTVVLNNGGIAYSPDICECGVKFNKAYEELLLEKFESKLRETTLRMEKLLADEQVARKQAEAMAVEAQLKSIAEINRLSEISRRDAGVLRKTRKKLKAEQERLEQGIQKKLEVAQREMVMLRKSWRESEQKLKEKINKAYEDQLLEMESMHREMTVRLEKKLEIEQVARMQAEAAQTKSNDEISRVREDFERAQSEARETTELLKKMIQEKEEENQKKNNLAISEITSAIEHKIESKLRETTQRLDNQLADKFAGMQAQIESKLGETTQRLDNQLADKFARMQAQIESKLGEMTERLENHLADEFGRMQAQIKPNDEISKLRGDMKRTQRYTKETLKKIRLRMDEENEEKNNSSVSEIPSTTEHQFESNIRERMLRFGQQFADEKVARMLAEGTTQVQNKNKGWMRYQS